MSQPQITVVPLTLPRANELVQKLHRHHAPIPGGFGWFCVGAVAEGVLVGCAIAGRPTNRNNDDGQTVEVLRVATDGTPNAPSCLLGACSKAARAIGARRIITYTLDSETGSSLRGAGWRREADGIESWWTHPGKDGKGRVAAVDRPHMAERKVRWGVEFRPSAVDYALPTPAEVADDHDLLSLLSEDVQALDAVPLDESAVESQAGAGHVVDRSLLAVDLDRPAAQDSEHVARVRLAPSQLHAADPNEATA